MMRLKNNILKNIKMIKNIFVLALIMLTVNSFSQERVKIDGVSVVVGKNIVLYSDIDNFKKEVELRSEGQVVISDCEMLEEIMMQKLLSHHAVIDSIVVSDERVEQKVDSDIASFSQSLRTEDLQKVADFMDLLM